MSQEDQLSSMTKEDFERKLSQATKIVNFNGQMTLFGNKAFNGKMTEYVISQIMYGYAPPSLGIGYEVNIVDCAKSKSRRICRGQFVRDFASRNGGSYYSDGTGTLDAVSPQRESGNVPTTHKAAAMLGLAEDYEMLGEISEVNLDVVDFESLLESISVGMC